MAEVFLAVACEATVSKLVVLKRIWPELASDPTFAAMFLDEARLSVRMSHPNVVQTHEVTEQDGRLTIAMEYLDGQPLTRVQNRLSAARGATELTLALRLRIIIEILAGLGHVHDLTDYDGRPLGVVHRDVSPHNVFITYDGHVKLVDFGVAKMVAASQETRPGTIKGKLAYMAPDQLRPQAQAQTIDRRADLFSVGVILWELLSGRRMWQGMTEVTIVRHLSYGLPLPPLRPMTALPSGLEDVCRKALAMNPDDRYASAGEMEHALQGMLPLVADSHTRHLGKLVSMAFARERAERQAVIDRNLGGGQRPGGETGPPESEPGEARELEPDGPSPDAELDGPAAGGDSTGPFEPVQDEPPAAGDPLVLLPIPPTRPTGVGVLRGRRWAATAALACGGLTLLGLLVLGGTRLHSGGPVPLSTGPTKPSAPAELAVAGGGQRPGRADVRVDFPTPRPTSRTVPLEASEAPRIPALRRARQHRRESSHERWAWRDAPEAGRGQSVQRWLPEGVPPGADTFSVELGTPPPSTPRREIDTESPFSP